MRSGDRVADAICGAALQASFRTSWRQEMQLAMSLAKLLTKGVDTSWTFTPYLVVLWCCSSAGNVVAGDAAVQAGWQSKPGFVTP